jgi:hypothetical protein
MPTYIYSEPENTATVFPEGIYPFEIVDILPYEWINDKEALPLIIKISTPEGAEKKVRETLFFTEKAKFRIDQLLKCVGKAPKPGTAVDFNNPLFLFKAKGRCEIGIKISDKGTQYNYVKNWIWGNDNAVQTTFQKASTPAPAINEDDPFKF